MDEGTNNNKRSPVLGGLPAASGNQESGFRVSLEAAFSLKFASKKPRSTGSRIAISRNHDIEWHFLIRCREKWLLNLGVEDNSIFRRTTNST
jgi:hypothetical protein